MIRVTSSKYAFRISTVRAAHKIIVLEHGRVSQLGTHEQLIAEGGLYRELVELQSGVIAEESSLSSADP